MDNDELKRFLNRKVKEYNRPAFIESDPIVVPHQFFKKQDIEIAGFFAATFAWGIRTTIIKKCNELMRLMDNSPHDFIIHHREKDRKRFEGFCHRTFNDTDLLYFITFLQMHYQKYDSLEWAFTGTDKSMLSNNSSKNSSQVVENALNNFYNYFFSLEDVPQRTRKHVAAPMKSSACKRLNMFLRWMVRNDNNGVDFGIWKKINPSDLICPLDLHVARVAKRFNLINRPAADWQTAMQLTGQLRKLDKKDPAKYDFALFALGVIERF